MGDHKLYKLQIRSIGADSVKYADYSRGVNNYNRFEKHPKMNLLHILAWSIGIPAWIYSYFADITDPQIDHWRILILAGIAVSTGMILLWRLFIKAARETIEFIRWLMPRSGRRRG